MVTTQRALYNEDQPRDDHGRFGEGDHASWVKSLEERNPGVKLDVTDHGSHISVDRIVVPQDERNKGTGSRIMKEVLARADAQGKPVTLTPSTDFGGTRSGLDRFYKGLGFVKNTGRNALYESSDSMVRYPKSKSSSSTGVARAMAGNAGNPQALIDWFNAGAGGQIDWGSPGDFEQCVAIAGEHMDDPEGFCQLRHIDATGEPAGKGAHGGAAMTTTEQAAADMPDGDMPTLGADDAPQGTPFNVLLRVEGLETSDGRMFELGGSSWRDLPIPFMIQDTAPHGPGQVPAPAWVGGQIDAVRRDPTDASRIIGRGHLMPNEAGQRAEEIARHGFRGVSTDSYGTNPLGPDQQPTIVDEDGEPISVLTRYADDTISRVTMVPTPAFESCCIWFDDEEMPDVAASAHGGIIPTDTPPAVVEVPNAYERLLASGGGPKNPPRSWFFAPEPDHYQPLQDNGDGHITGHIARAGQCHIGHVGKCETAPKSTTSPPFKAFHRTIAQCDDGSEVACGWLTIDTKHQWDFGADAQATADHYDHTGTLVAKLRASNGRHGIWVSGAAVPGLSDRQAWLLQGPEVSGDWRRYVDPDTNRPHNRELLSILAVPVPGFPGTRVRPELLVASGEIVAQHGMLDPCDCDEQEGEPMTPDERAELDEMKTRLGALETMVASAAAPVDDADVDALVASMELDGVDLNEPLSAAESGRYAAKYNTADRKKMAGDGSAMPDGGYPIADADDLKNAIRAVGRGSGSHNAIRKHIMARAKAIGQTKLIPANWNADGSTSSADENGANAAA